MVRFPWFLLSVAVCLALAPVSPAPAETGSSEPDASIRFLLEFVRTSNCSFIRNGTPHTAVEAVAHLTKKYEYYKKDIKTPEDFIRLAAPKSELSGKPYLIKLPGGTEERSDAWLLRALEQHRK